MVHSNTSAPTDEVARIVPHIRYHILCMRRRAKLPSVETIVIIVAVGLGFRNYRVVMLSEAVGMSMIATRIERIRVVKILAADTETAKMEGKIVKM